MRRVIVASVILFITVLLSFFGFFYTTSKTDLITKEISNLKEKIAVCDETSIVDSYNLIKNWKNTHEAFSFYMSHDRIGQIDETLSQIPAYLVYGNFADAASLCDKANRQISDLTENEKVSAGNIL